MMRHSIQTLILTLLTSLFLTNFTVSFADTGLEIATVEEKSFPQIEVFDAVIEAIHDSTVSSRISAEVVELNYDVNDVVPKDAVIMKFRDEEFQARVAQIQAGLSADKAQSREASARYKEASSESTRVKSLFKRKLLSQAALDKANADLSVANAKLQAVQAQIKSRQAQLDEAKVQLSYTTIVAPYSGVVTERFIELGEMASPGQHLMTGVSLEHLRAVVNIPQYLIAAIKSADKPILKLVDGREVIGTKITVIPQADVKSHSFKMRVDLPVNSESIYPGMFGKLQFIVGDEYIRVVPQSAIVQRSEVSGVYVLSEGQRLIFRQVRLGRKLDNGQREVLAGLSIEEQVAVDPLAAAKQLKMNSSRSQL